MYVSYNTLVTPQDILNTLIVIGFLIITICIIFITYFLVRALKAITNLANSLENASLDIKDRLQNRAFSLIPALLVALIGKILKKGR